MDEPSPIGAVLVDIFPLKEAQVAELEWISASAMRLLLVGYLVALGGGCAAHVWLNRPIVLDEYLTAHVRIYRADTQCRVEVTTPTETILTVPTKCVSVPHRRTP